MNSLQLNSFPINAHYRFSNKIDNTSCIYNTFYGFSSQLKLNLKKNTLKLGSKSVAKERVSIHSELSVVYDKKPKVERSKNGIGILNFLPGKNYFISGATGLLAKAVVEKILRATPEVGKIYLLIKAESKEAALDRIKYEIINSTLFNLVRDMHGESYQDFMLSKLVPVPGNIGESNLGMNPDLVNEIATDVDVIINSAANTTFDERFDVAVNINTKGPSQILNFAKQCKKLCCFIHVSTAYVTMGNFGETLTSKTTPLSHPTVDVDAEVKLALDSSLAFHRGAELTQKMKEMGLERAKSCGWKNVYEFTKAMGELVIDKNRGEIPVAIVRPSIVESTFREPFPGWIQGNRMIDPVAIAYGKGHLPAFLNPKTVIDIIPVDMVVNAIISAVAKHGVARKPGLNVYHVSSSGVNPVTFADIFDFLYEHFKSYPLKDVKGKTVDIKRVKIFSSVEDVLPCISKAVMERYGVASGPDGLPRKFCEKIIDQSTKMVKTYEPYYTSRCFDSTETYKLWEAMSEDEKLNFGFDVKSLDWRNYFINIHVPGLRKYVIKNGR